MPERRQSAAGARFGGAHGGAARGAQHGRSRRLDHAGPARPDIHAAKHDLFLELGSRLSPRVETETQYIEDESLGYQCNDPKFSSGGGGCLGDDDYDDDSHDSGPIGNNHDDLYDPGTEDADLQMVMIGDDVVRFEDALSTPDYDVQVINASSAQALDVWLDLNGFAHDDEDDAAFAAYVTEGAWFVALDVHPAGHRDLQPIVVSFRSDTIPLLHRLQYDSAGGELVTDAFVMAPWRMDASDGSAETLYAAPAGFGGSAAGFGLSQGWLTHLKFTRDTAVSMEDSAIDRTGKQRSAPGATPHRARAHPIVGVPIIVVVRRQRLPVQRRRAAARPHLTPVLLACLWLARRGRRPAA